MPARGRSRTRSRGRAKRQPSASEDRGDHASDVDSRIAEMEKKFAGEHEEQALRIRLLEKLLTDKKSSDVKKRRHSPSGSSSGSSSSTESSDSDSGSSSEGRTGSKKKKKKHTKRASYSVPAKKWKTTSYEVQHSLNATTMRTMKKARRHLEKEKSKQSKKMAKQLQKGEQALQCRQEWLVIADAHGHETATKFQEEGEMGDIVASSGKRRKLMAAIQVVGSAVKRQPFRSRTPANAARGWGAAVSGTQSVAQAQEAKSNKAGPRRLLCYGCGSPDHIKRFCPQQKPVEGNAQQQ